MTIEAYRRHAAAAMTEAELQGNVIALARQLGYFAAHFRPARTADGWRTPVAADGVGFPDLVLARAHCPAAGRSGRLLFVELKSARGRLGERQERWLDVLRAAGAEVHVWRPRDWLSGEIERVLNELDKRDNG